MVSFLESGLAMTMGWFSDIGIPISKYTGRCGNCADIACYKHVFKALLYIPSPRDDTPTTTLIGTLTESRVAQQLRRKKEINRTLLERFLVGRLVG